MDLWEPLSLSALCAALVCCGGDDSRAPLADLDNSDLRDCQSDEPQVVASSPEHGATGVDAGLAEISVTFDRPMRDGTWSWVQKDAPFPEVVGEPRYEDDNTKNVLPVELESGVSYVVWINGLSHTNFMDESGTPACPFVFTFDVE